jgi:protein-S-isoprenylcysteine O-methyltransferase Ste14
MFGRFTGGERGRRSFDRRRVPLLIAAAVFGPFFLLVAPRWSDPVQHLIQIFGITMIVVFIVGRTWCYMFVASHKTYEVMTSGPYSIIRNPLYAFSVVGGAGTGALFGALAFSVALGGAVAIILYRRSLEEEKAMLALHGDLYRQYMNNVPRFLPRHLSWQSPQLPLAKPQTASRTFVDACLVLLILPCALYTRYLQETGIIPVLAFLP